MRDRVKRMNSFCGNVCVEWSQSIECGKHVSKHPDKTRLQYLLIQSNVQDCLCLTNGSNPNGISIDEIDFYGYVDRDIAERARMAVSCLASLGQVND